MNGRSGSGEYGRQDRGEEAEGSSSPCPMRPGPLDTVALDIRPSQEYTASGVGHLGKVGVKNIRGNIRFRFVQAMAQLKALPDIRFCPLYFEARFRLSATTAVCLPQTGHMPI